MEKTSTHLLHNGHPLPDHPQLVLVLQGPLERDGEGTPIKGTHLERAKGKKKGGRHVIFAALRKPATLR